MRSTASWQAERDVLRRAVASLRPVLISVIGARSIWDVLTRPMTPDELWRRIKIAPGDRMPMIDALVDAELIERRAVPNGITRYVRRDTPVKQTERVMKRRTA